MKSCRKVFIDFTKLVSNLICHWLGIFSVVYFYINDATLQMKFINLYCTAFFQSRVQNWIVFDHWFSILFFLPCHRASFFQSNFDDFYSVISICSLWLYTCILTANLPSGKYTVYIIALPLVLSSAWNSTLYQIQFDFCKIFCFENGVKALLIMLYL